MRDCQYRELVLSGLHQAFFVAQAWMLREGLRLASSLLLAGFGSNVPVPAKLASNMLLCIAGLVWAFAAAIVAGPLTSAATAAWELYGVIQGDGGKPASFTEILRIRPRP